MHSLSVPKNRPQSVPEIVDYLIALALRHKASDIHLAANHQATTVDPYLLRYRIHGKLQMVRSDFIGPHYKEVVSRLKVLAGMNITETHAPQDGQIKVSLPDQSVVTLRVSTVPGQEFEDLCIRVQRQTESNLTLDTLAIPADLKARLEELIRQKSGMIVLNGPAGSGKTTTIYSILGTLSSPERKIITAEDPIESRLPYVCHTQVGPKTNFAALARAFMRQDADVIFIGEVRDQDSAEAAIQLAQTGHLVLTTLHTRDAIGVISRLEALNIHPNLISSTLIGSLSQRLVPRLCASCRTPYRPDAALVRGVARIAEPPAGTTFYRQGPGCPKCVGGIAGRIPIFELFVADAELSDLINRGAPKMDIFAAARRKGMRTLAEDALTRVYGGYTDLGMIQGFVLGPDARSESVRSAAPPAAAGETRTVSRSIAVPGPAAAGDVELELHPPSVSAAVDARSVRSNDHLIDREGSRVVSLPQGGTRPGSAGTAAPAAAPLDPAAVRRRAGGG